MDEVTRSDIARAVEVLQAAGAREVYLFGSCATAAMGEHCDVDLGVNALPSQSFFKAMSQATAVLPRPLDLIDLDEPTPFTRYLKKERLLRRVG